MKRSLARALGSAVLQAAMRHSSAATLKRFSSRRIAILFVPQLTRQTIEAYIAGFVGKGLSRISTIQRMDNKSLTVERAMPRENRLHGKRDEGPSWLTQ
jgi:hypothetical protein